MEGHASWVEAYYPPGLKASSLPPLYEWMLGHARGEANATGGASDERDARASRTHAGVARASRLAAAQSCEAVIGTWNTASCCYGGKSRVLGEREPIALKHQM